MSVVAVCSGKRSPGATFLAVNLACALVESGQPALLIDLDGDGGDLAAHLGLDPRRGLYPLLHLEGRGPTPEALLREAEARGRLLCLAGFARADDADPEAMLAILEAARATGRLIVADLGRVRPASAHVPRAADLVLIAVRPDLATVFGAERAIDLLVRAGVERDRMAVVVTGWQPARLGDLSEVSEALRLEVMAAIPLDDRAARKALLAQTPLMTGRAARAFSSLAAGVGAALERRAGREEVPA